MISRRTLAAASSKDPTNNTADHQGIILQHFYPKENFYKLLMEKSKSQHQKSQLVFYSSSPRNLCMLKRFSVIGLIHTRPAIKYSCLPKTRVNVCVYVCAPIFRSCWMSSTGKDTACVFVCVEDIPIGIHTTFPNSIVVPRRGKYTFSHILNSPCNVAGRPNG